MIPAGGKHRSSFEDWLVDAILIAFAIDCAIWAALLVLPNWSAVLGSIQ